MGYKWEFHCIGQKEPPAHGQPDRESISRPLEPKSSMLALRYRGKENCMNLFTIAEFVPSMVDTQN